MRLIILLLLIAHIVESKERTALSFLKIGIGPRALGMGGAFTSIADDPTALYWNPAGMSSITEPELFLEHTEMGLGIRRESTLFVQPTEHGVFGVAIDHLWTNRIEKRRGPTDEPEGYFSCSDTLVGIGISRRLKENLTLGLSGKLITERLDDERKSAVSLDGGLLYRGSKVNIGLSIKDLGTGIAGYNLPLSIRAGISWPLRERISLCFGLDRYIFEEETEVLFGGEAMVLEGLSARAGYILSSDGRSRWSAGFGLGAKYGIGYVYLPNELGGSHHFSLFTPLRGLGRVWPFKEPIGLEIMEISLREVFPSKYKYYTSSPLGTLTLKNPGREEVSKIKISLSIPKAMKYPYQYEIDDMPPASTKVVPLYCSFDDEQILSRDEDTTMQAKIDVSYLQRREKRSISITRPLILYNRNLIDWREKPSIAAFVTPNDTAIRLFSRRVTGMSTEDTITLEKRLVYALELFSALSIYPISYLSDSSKQAFGKDIALDTIQYPRETLQFTKGDCDDLAVLYAACLESIGIPTAFIDLPSHILLMFNTGIREDQKELLSFDPSSYILRDGTCWIPVETTYLKGSFLSAWKKGIEEYEREKGVEIIEIADCWRVYPPVALPPADWKPKIPEERVLKERIRREFAELRSWQEEVAEKRIREYMTRIESVPDDISSINSLGIIYAKMGRINLAYDCFERAKGLKEDHPSPYNNIANLHLLEGRYDEAFSSYKEAMARDPGCGKVVFNLGICYLAKGEERLAERMFTHSLRLSPELDTAYLSDDLTKGRVQLSISEIKRLLKEAKEKVPRPERDTPHKPVVTQAKVARMDEVSCDSSKRLLTAILYWR